MADPDDMGYEESERARLRKFRNELVHNLTSIPSTTAVSATLSASGSQMLRQYGVPMEVIKQVSEEQAHKVIEENLIPIIDVTADRAAERTIKKHAEEERQEESKPKEKAKRFGWELFWIVVGILITMLLGVTLRSLGIPPFW